MDRDNDFIHAWPTGFMLIQGNRLESLRGLMTTWMQRHPLHPLENEIILVQSNGIGQWLKLALAAPRAHDSASDDSAGDHLGGGCGIAAALDLMLPSRFLWQAYRAVLGDLPETSAYDKAPLAWRLYRLLGDLDALAEDDEEARWLDPLRGFLAVDGDARRRQQLAERLADLYDQYQVYRADWLSAWQQSDDVLPGLVGAGRPLPDGQRWQPLLWRLLKANIAGAGVDAASGQSHTESSRAEIHQRFLRQARTLTWSTRPQELPRRVIVFGISSLPRQAIEVLESIAPVAQVMLFVQNPSQHYWGDLVEGRELFRRAYRRNAAREKVPDGLDENALHLHGHPLLAAWGKQGRDYIRLLDEHDDRSRYEAHFADQRLQIDLFESPGAETLLQQLQDDILELRPLHERREQATAIDPAQDRSLEFLIAHSPQREVEILHDQLLDAFAAAEHAGTPLPPRDILVMVPDIATYAPHIEAVFGRLPSDDPRRIPFQIADQGKRQRDPLLIGFEVLLNLPQARFAVSELLDLLEIPALRARFRLDEAQLPLLRQWIEGANIRWGLDAEQRAGLDLPQGLEQNSWRFGLKRMLLGFATGDSGPWQGIEPFDEIGGLDAALVGPLMQLLETLSESWALLQQPRRPADWNALLAERLDALFRADSETDELALSEIRQALEQWLLDATRGGAEGEPLPLEVVRDTLLVGLDAPTLSQRFLVGAVNFATLMPMRAIPFRQIWLLGMNDGDYPRSRRPADFDLMANDYRPGDRSRREDDRYLFLEALLAARERLVISWVGRSIRDDSERPPSVLVGQLRDHIKAGWQLAPAAAAVVTQCADEANVPSTDAGTDQKASPDTSRAALVAALTTTHPLQPFSRRYFEETGDPRLFTYAREWRDLHRPLAQAPTAIPERPPQLSAPTFDGPINLITLGRFLRHPVPTFYTQRLSLYLGQEAEQQDNEEPFDVDALTSWGLRAAIVESIEQQLVAQPDIASELCLQSAVERLARAGELPLPPFDVDWCADLQAQLSAPLWRYRELLEAYCEPQAISSFGFEAAGLVLEDSLSGLRADAGGNRLQLRLQPSVLVKKQELSWHHLVRHWPGHLAAQCDGPTSTCLLGPASEVWLRPLRRDQAEHQLSELMEGYVQGLSQPLPLACKTAFAELRATAGESGANPAQTFEGSDYYRGECDEHVGYQRFWPDYAALSAAADYLALIHRLYGPLYQHAHESKEI